MSPSYDRNLKRLGALKGCKMFAATWELHVANLCKWKVEGVVGAVLINRKSYMQLQEHFDMSKKQE